MKKNVRRKIKLKITHTLSESQKQDLQVLYKNEWWSNTRTAQDIERILAGSTFVVGITTSEKDKLIAFARVLSDQFKFAYIYDVIVATEYRKKGIGKTLLETILTHPLIQNIKSVELLCQKDKSPFYEQFGFSTDYGTSIPMRKINSSVDVT